MNIGLQSAIRIACEHAIASLGDGYKGMSCFMNNWQAGAKVPEPVDLGTDVAAQEKLDLAA